MPTTLHRKLVEPGKPVGRAPRANGSAIRGVTLVLKLIGGAALVCLIGSSTIAGAQTTSGRLVGQVLDQSRSPLADAKVTVVNERNGNARATVTGTDGRYIVPFLTPGSYSITATLTGYQDSGVKGFIVPLNSTSDLRPPDITLLQPSPTAAPTVTPTTTTAARDIGVAINTSDATRRANFPQIEIELLPIDPSTSMRSFDELALLAPGVSPPPYTPGLRGPGVGFGVGTAGEFSVNGARARSNNFTVDGSDNNDPDVGVRRQGFVALVPQPIESIQEFEVSTLLWDAELGRNLGSEVNAVSKGGGNAFHGEAYGFFTDSRLNARNFFDYTGGPSGGKDPFTKAQVGFVFGGPIVQNRTQFFISFERDEINAAAEQHFSTPTLAERDFRNFLQSIGVCSSPAGSQCAGPPDHFSVDQPVGRVVFNNTQSATPLGSNILSFYPLPNDPGGIFGPNTFTQILPSGGDASIFSGKVNHQVTAKNNLAVRYNFTDDSLIIPGVNRAINSSLNSKTRTQDVSLILDTALSPNLFSQARFSYGRTNLAFQPLAQSPLVFSSASQVLLNFGQGPRLVSSATGPIGELLIEPFSPVGVDAFTFPQGRADNTFQYADSVSWKLHSHSVKFGADLRRVQLNSFQDRNYRPEVIYGDSQILLGDLTPTVSGTKFSPTSGGLVLPGVALASLGVPTSIEQTLTSGPPNSEVGLRFTEMDFFINDNWQLRSNLALDYGLRYEYNTVPRDANSRIENAISLRNLPQPGGSRFDDPAFTAAYNAAVGAYKTILDNRHNIYAGDGNNLGPHVGVAWDPWGDGRTAVRAGVGLYYDAILGAVVSQSRNVFPTEIPVNIDPTFGGLDVFTLHNPVFAHNGDASLILPGTLNQLGGAPSDFAALVGSLFFQNQGGGGLAFTLPEKHPRTPYSEQWMASIERRVGGDYVLSVSYVGSRGVKLTRLVTPNLGPNKTITLPVAIDQAAVFGPTVASEFVASLLGRRPNSAIGAYQIFEDSASSNYHSFQFEAQKRYSRGYSVTAAYTFSHAIDDVSDVFPVAGGSVLAEDQNNQRLERGNAGFDIRHHFAASLVWDLPFYRNTTGNGARWLGGWQVATIFQAHSGQPFTLTLPIDANLDGNLTDRPLTTDGLQFFSGSGRQKVAIAPGHTLSDFFVFGQDGFVGRNTVRGAGFVNWDLALVKSFRITESQTLVLRAEGFNVL
ncbi:MAG TPA: carboxypeptidase-like regulatory domain-containing protein, partial [Blastocatellia bacterium]|nr:carboxypeptidase-like regulatory domain-containing protein [Blastocatellia bacterium]